MSQHSENVCLNTLKQQAFLHVNFQLMYTLGLVEANVMAILIDRYEYYKRQETLLEDGWFYIKNDVLEQTLHISAHQRKCAIGILSQAGIITTDRRGFPPKVHYQIQFDQLERCLQEDPLILNRQQLKKEAGLTRHNTYPDESNSMTFSKTPKISNLTHVTKTEKDQFSDVQQNTENKQFDARHQNEPICCTSPNQFDARHQNEPINNRRADKIDQNNQIRKEKGPASQGAGSAPETPVSIFRSTFLFSPNKEWHETLNTTIADLKTWRLVCVSWQGNPKNYKGLLNKYQRQCAGTARASPAPGEVLTPREKQIFANFAQRHGVIQ